MDKWDKLAREIVDYLQGTRLARAPIEGNSEAELDAAEQQIGKALPKALRAWYRAAGKVPPYLNDYDADFSLNDLLHAQETAEQLTQFETCKWKLTPNSVPFSQRIGEQFLMVHSDEEFSDDPPVFHFMEESERPRLIQVSFSSFIREMWLNQLDFPAWSRENSEEIRSWRKKGYADESTRKQIVDNLREEVRVFRNGLIERVHLEDVARDEITGPQAFQERWIAEFSESELWKRMLAEGMRFPYNWTRPPTDEA